MKHAAPRRQDWPEALAAYIVDALRRPHAWGSHDCVTFACGAVEAMTGVAPVLPVKPWRDRAEAEAALDAIGGLAAAVDTVLPRLPSVHAAHRGDIVMIQPPPTLGAQPWLAVVYDDMAWAPALDISGLRPTSMDHAAIAWRVGFEGAHG